MGSTFTKKLLNHILKRFHMILTTLLTIQIDLLVLIHLMKHILNKNYTVLP
jgi:hypothetical protein